MFVLGIQNTTFLILSGTILALKATLENRSTGWCRRKKQCYVRVWARVLGLDNTYQEHFEEFAVASETVGSEILKSIHDQFAKTENKIYNVSDYDDIEPLIGSAEHYEETLEQVKEN